MRSLWSVVGVACLVAGCARLEIAEAVPGRHQGIRVRTPVSYIIVKQVTRKSGLKQKVEEIVHLPVGEAYDVDVRPAWFGKTEFSVSFNDQGVLKQVTLNSDPKVVETIQAVGSVLEKVPGFRALAAPPDDPVVEEVIVEVRRLQIKE